MGDSSDYRERPRTGVTDQQAGEELDRPQRVDPAVLTDDRGNKDLLVFEKTWGHRLLAGVGVAMLVVALVLIIYCALQLGKVSGLSGIADYLVTFGYLLYGFGLAAGIAVVPPAIVGIYVAKHPKRAGIAVAFAVVGLVLVGCFVVYAVVVGVTNLVSVFLYALLFAVLPVLYLIAALKIGRS